MSKQISSSCVLGICFLVEPIILQSCSVWLTLRRIETVSRQIVAVAASVDQRQSARVSNPLSLSCLRVWSFWLRCSSESTASAFALSCTVKPTDLHMSNVTFAKIEHDILFQGFINFFFPFLFSRFSFLLGATSTPPARFGIRGCCSKNRHFGEKCWGTRSNDGLSDQQC